MCAAHKKRCVHVGAASQLCITGVYRRQRSRGACRSRVPAVPHQDRSSGYSLPPPQTPTCILVLCRVPCAWGRGGNSRCSLTWPHPRTQTRAPHAHGKGPPPLFLIVQTFFSAAPHNTSFHHVPAARSAAVCGCGGVVRPRPPLCRFVFCCRVQVAQRPPRPMASHSEAALVEVVVKLLQRVDDEVAAQVRASFAPVLHHSVVQRGHRVPAR